MGQLDTFTATSGNTKKKFKIDRNCQKLMIVRHSTLALKGKLLANLPEILTIENTTNTNRRQSVGDRIFLGYLAGFAQWGEGVIPEAVVGSTVVAHIPVVLGLDAFDVSANDNFTVVIENMIVGATYDVYALETPVVGPRFWEYLQGSILAGDHQKAIDLDGASAIILPSAAAISRATVTYATDQGDKTCDYTLQELLFMNAEGNDLEILSTYKASSDVDVSVTSAYGSMTSELIVLTLAHIKHIVFHTDGSLIDYVTVTERNRDSY